MGVIMAAHSPKSEIVDAQALRENLYNAKGR